MQRRPSALHAAISWTILPRRGSLAGPLRRQNIMPGGAIREVRVATVRKIFSGVRVLAGGILRRVLDIGLRAVAAGGGLGVPLAVGRLVFDGFSTPGHALLGRGALGSRKRGGVARKGFRECAFDGISPAAIMLDDFVGDMGHR